MFLQKVELEGWKPFVKTSFTFPKPSREKNICLIGAPNGFGKTSLLQAIIFCLYGEKGLTLNDRQSLPFDSEDKLKIPYRQFMKKALNEYELASGRRQCAVELTFFDDESEELISIKRIWHYNSSGEFLNRNEEIFVYEGTAREPRGPDLDDSREHGQRLEWYQDYIGGKLAPFPLASFFLYDGEQASSLAEVSMEDQVRAGIEGFLGVPILRTLEKDLRQYSAQQIHENISGKEIEEKEKDRERLERIIKDQESSLTTGKGELRSLTQRRDMLTREIVGVGVDSQAQLEEQLGLINKYKNKIAEDEESLAKSLIKDIPLALASKRILEKTTRQLKGEKKLESWDDLSQKSSDKLNHFLDRIGLAAREVDPRLNENQISQIVNKAKEIWRHLWLPKPEDCAEGYRHLSLKGSDRDDVLSRFSELEAKSISTITELLDSIERHKIELAKLEADLEKVKSSPAVEDKRQELSHLQEQIASINRKIGITEHELTGHKGELRDVTTHLAQLVRKKSLAEPSARRANSALVVADMVDHIITTAVPRHVKAIASSMTEAYKAMLHKKDFIERIEVDEKCNVKLYNSRDEDVRSYDLSAGEKQLFTQALIHAVTDSTGKSFPMVIDTPLGRLDEEHRKNILSHMADRDCQIILLSTDTEVVGDYLAEIAPNVCSKYQIIQEPYGDRFGSKAVPGYFGE